jgi:centromeric protein E
MDSKEENITVAVRLRPLQDREVEAGVTWEAGDWRTVKEIKGPREFAFDRVYQQTVQTGQIFADLARVVVEKTIEGYNGCIFCYGQTGSGKTFTMHGSKKSPGIVPLAIEALFECIQAQEQEKEFLVRCSYVEIYNESVNDLLNENLLNLQLAEDASVSGI